MSRETVYALRRITQKLAADTAKLANLENAGLEPTGTTDPSPPLQMTPADAPKPTAPAGGGWLETLAPFMPAAAGIGIGGLGAYGLARLMQSREEKERNRFPWLATLLGAAGGGALGYGLGNPDARKELGYTYNRYTPFPTETVKNDRVAEDNMDLEPGATESLGPNAPMRAAQRGDSTPR